MYQRIYDGTLKLLKGFLILNMVVIVFLVAIQVFSRYILDNPTTWSEEAATYALVYFTFLGSALAIGEKQMLKIRILPEALPKDKSILLDIFTNTLSILLLLSILYFSMPVFQKLYTQLTPALRMSKSLVFLAVPIGSLLMIMTFINEIKDLLKEYKDMKTVIKKEVV